MGALDKLETNLDEALNKRAPVQIPQNGRKSIAQYLWIIALVFGILQLLAAWEFWRVGHWVDRAVDAVNSLSVYYGGSPVAAEHLGPIYYVSLLILVATAVLMLLAVPGLKAFQKAGWNFMFYSVLLNALYGVVRVFSEVGGGVGLLIWSLLCSLIAAWLLFQVRDQFKGASSVGHKARDHKAHPPLPPTPPADKQ
jgi:hypothetical protein